MPGYRCPPVPPPAITTRNGVGQSGSSRPLLAPRHVALLLRHVQQNAHAEQVDEQRRSAEADERQRNAFRRQQPERNADVEQRLHGHHRGQAQREKRAETCRVRAARLRSPRQVISAKHISTAVAPTSPSSSEMTE